MIRLAAVPLLALAVAAPPPADDARALVGKLGSPEFAEREAAAKRLEELAAAALDELRPACQSENPEVARRAQELVRKIERKLANEKILAPTLVELDAKDAALDAVLADLSKQSGYVVVGGGADAGELAVKKVTVSTGGKVPFWAAVLAVCDAADLRVALAGGFVAPDAGPQLRRQAPGVGPSRDVERGVLLEARGGAKRRPAAVLGAVLVEAVPFPKTVVPGQPSVLLQVWPEPRVAWEGTTGAKAARATDAAGTRLGWEFVPPDAPDVRRTADGMILVRNPDGSASFVRDTGAAFQLPGGFKPNTRQAVVRFKPGGKSPGSAKELAVTVGGVVRSGIEPLCRIGGLESNKPATATGPGTTELAVTYGPDGGGGLVAHVQVAFDPREVQPAGVGDDLPGVRGGAAGVGNSTVQGVRITDADGKPYTLGLSTGLTRREPSGTRTTLIQQLGLYPDKNGHGPPAVATFWGTQARPVEVAVTLRDVPLAGGN